MIGHQALELLGCILAGVVQRAVGLAASGIAYPFIAERHDERVVEISIGNPLDLDRLLCRLWAGT